MTICRAVAVQCDYEAEGVRCPLTWERSSDAHWPKNGEVRRDAFRHGWIRKGERDLCPLHQAGVFGGAA